MTMIESIAGRWVNWIKSNDPNNPFTHEFLFSTSKAMLNLIFCYAIVLAVGYLNGRLLETFLALQSFVTLRLFSGGFHFKSLDLCTIVSSALIIPIPFLAGILDASVVMILNSVSLALVIIYAPTNLKSTVWTDRAKPIFKAISICIVLYNFFENSAIFAISLALQALLLVKFNSGGESNNDHIEQKGSTS